jgi:uncharacterized protein YjbI with pentapeptide repeats
MWTLVAPRILEPMTRSESGRPTPPRLPPDLSSESDLCLTAGYEIDHATIQGDFSHGDLEGLHVEDSRIVGSSFTAADLNRLRLIDVVVEGSDFSGADMEEASFIRVTFTDCRMSGALFPRAQMQDVTFSEVRLDQVNFRMIEGERVAFDHVNLEQSEFYSAHLKAASFFDCDLSGADVSQVKLPGARFHGSVLSDLKGSEYLRDVVIETAQVLPLANGVFAALNIRVEDDREVDVGPTDGEESSNRESVPPSRHTGLPSESAERTSAGTSDTCPAAPLGDQDHADHADKQQWNEAPPKS